MAIDKKYLDNVVLKRSALQNLLTNIKNYPIIDIDYIEPGETDEYYQDDIWSNYTNGSPCIKITYGDSETTKGNVMFHNENRALIAKANKEIARLETLKSQLTLLKRRWLQIKENNERELRTKAEQLTHMSEQLQLTLDNKYNFLLTVYRYFNFGGLDNEVEYEPLKNTVIDSNGYITNRSKEDVRANFDLYYLVVDDQNNESYVPNSIDFSGTNAKIENYDINRKYFNRHSILYDDNNYYTFPAFIHNEDWEVQLYENSTPLVIKLQLLDDSWKQAICQSLQSFADNMVEGNQKQACLMFIDYLQQYNNLILLDTIKETNLQQVFTACTQQDSYDPNKTYYYYKSEQNEYFIARYTVAQDPNDASTVGPWRNNMAGFYYIDDTILASIYKYVEDNYQPIYGLENIYNTVVDQVDDVVNTIMARLNQNIKQAKQHIEYIEDDIEWLEVGHIDVENIVTEYNNRKNLVYLGQADNYLDNDPDDDLVYIDGEQIQVHNGNVILSNGNLIKFNSNNNWEALSADLMYLFMSDHNIAEVFSIEDYNNIIRFLNNQLNNTQDTPHSLVRGYKYVKVGGGVDFTHNKGLNERNQEYLIYEKINNPDTTLQRYGHFRIDINNDVYEVGIKGFNMSSTSAVFINTDTVLNGTLYTQNGNIYASGGAVIGSTYLGIRAYPGYNEDNTNNGTRETAGLWFDGKTNTIQAYNITKTNNDVNFAAATATFSQSVSTPSIYATNIMANTATATNSINSPIGRFHTVTTTSISSMTGNFHAIATTSIRSMTGNFNTIVTTAINAVTANFNAIVTTAIQARTGNFHTVTTTALNVSTINGKDFSFTSDTTKFLRHDGSWTNILTNDSSDNTFVLQNTANSDNHVRVKVYNQISDNSIYLESSKSGNHGIYSTGYGSSASGTHGTTAGWLIYRGANSRAISQFEFSAPKVYNAVFNDYAEYRTTIEAKPGQCVYDNDDGSLSISDKFLIPGAQIVSDTFGHAMGETDDCKTPLAVAGRVLVYTYQPRENYHAGMCVCSAPGGTVNIMSRKDIQEYPDCIVGIVSEIPDYEYWGTDNVKVDGRIWIKVK